jgi:thymidine phosphorylase
LRKGDPIDHAVGLEIPLKVGDPVEAGKPLFTIHANSQSSLLEARADVLAAYRFSERPVAHRPLFFDVK